MSFPLTHENSSLADPGLPMALLGTGSNKVEGAPSPVSLSGHMTPKNELHKTSLSWELTGMNKE